MGASDNKKGEAPFGSSPLGNLGGVLVPPLFPENDLLKGTRAVKRQSLSFWEGNRLDDLLELARERPFYSGAHLTASDLARDAKQSASCGHHLRLHYPAPDVSTGEVLKPYINKGYFCQMPAVCQVCSRRVGDVRQARYAPKMEEALAAGYEPYLVTFTVSPSTSVEEQLKRLRRALRRFQTLWRLPADPEKRKAAIKRGRVGGEWQKVVAAGLKIEVKIGEGSLKVGGAPLWHVHAHALVFTSVPLDYRIYADRAARDRGEPLRLVEFRGEQKRGSKISAEWLAATEGDAMGVDVHPLYIDRKTGKPMSRDGVVQAAREVMKYTCDLDVQSTSDAWLDVRAGTWGRRLWSVYGGFRGADSDDYTETREGVDLVDEINVTWRGGWSGDYAALGKMRRVSTLGRKEFSLKCLTIRARVNGMCRKMRTAIFRARAAFESTGELPDEFDIEMISPRDGELRAMSWPRPNYLTVDAALDGQGWERWTNEVTAAARYMLASVESDLSEIDGDDMLGFRLGGCSSVNESTWTAWRLALDLMGEERVRLEAFRALQRGGIQLDAFAPDYFDDRHVDDFLARHDYAREDFREGYFEPAWVDPAIY